MPLFRDVLRPAYRLGKDFTDRLVHPLRRRRGIAAAGQCSPGVVLFVCYGNICRSPYAELAASAMLPVGLRKRIHVESAGFYGPQRRPPAEAIEAARARGVDLSLHRSRLLTPAMVARANIAFIMEERHREQLVREAGSPAGPVLVLGELDPEPWQPGAIEDPYGMPLAVFNQTYERIDRCLRHVIAVWTGRT